VFKWKFGGREILNLRPITYIRPPYVRFYRNNITEATHVVRYQLSNGASPLTFVSSMYAFYRGGLRTKIYASGSDTLVSGRVNYVLDTGKTGTAERYYQAYMGPTAYEQPVQKKFAEFQIPYYSPTVVTVHWDATDISQFSQPSTVLEISCTEADQDNNVWVALAAADDMDFHSFLGVPFVVAQDVIGGTWSTSPPVPSFLKDTIDVDPAYPLSYDTVPDLSNQDYLRLDNLSWEDSSDAISDPRIESLRQDTRSSRVRPLYINPFSKNS